MSRYQAPKGTYDILPPESAWWRDARSVFDDLAEQFGYGFVITPMFEDTDVFARSVGADSEIVQKQMYTFTDKGGRSITLRPEATASVVRAVIQAGGVQGRFKGAYWGEMFRYERPQKGRNRQFIQAGVEYLGSESPEADVEVIEFGYRMLERLAVPRVEVRINSIGDPEDREVYREALGAFLREHYDELSEDSRRRVESNPMRVLDSKFDRDILEDAPVPLDYLGEEAARHFQAVRDGLSALGIPFVIHDKLVRGLDYYTRTVWEYIPTGYEAAQTSVGGGGRYDGLFELLGGKPTPAVGLAMGVDRILLASSVPDPGHALDVFVVVADESLRSEARILTSELRAGGLRIDMTDTQRSVKAQFKEADRSNARAAVVIGAEWTGNEVTIKDLDSGVQDVIAIKEIEGWLRVR
ncbi:MAG: histidine--tRNA ligase [Actinomycetota bacterium]|nr:histidine--tRNA ligase [Actinomycetota bacterium]MDK1016758.1 histidine--tRNA ligase [Actinomycetota bacterium]MDK1026406.1 histidine--tRNA ligase [Actinomycetota bacterium]MDK1037574.1 histidine--tRNA ligase [Actinomycetota bacterium]MDK1097398.1 histidine--tRNA ligase [Actinomycetota bacterium]